MTLLDIQNLTKTFPGVVALDGVSMSVRKGEVHALLGENGAGKSTLLKILAGVQQQDSGTLTFGEQSLEHQSPLERQKQGIVTIYQEFNLLPSMSVADNIFIGREPLNGIFINRKRMLEESRKLLEQLELRISPAAEVRDLSVAQQQMVEIAKALSVSAELIVMDEPTAALSEREVTELHRLINDLRRKGVTIIYVTHRLAEIFEICDRYTVLRDGRLAGIGSVADANMSDIIKLMVGRDVEVTPAVPNSRLGKPVLEVRDLSTARQFNASHSGALHKLSLKVHKGEIVGIAGLVGAGRTELARAIFGADPLRGGEILIDGKLVTIEAPSDAIREGIAFVPEDRKQHGLFLIHSVRQNFALPNLPKFLKWRFFVSEQEEEAAIQKYKQSLGIRMPNTSVFVGTLSGGNQQKIILARCMHLKPMVLIVDEPTRGIDIGSKSEVHRMLAGLAKDGMGILIISSELPEIMAVSHRIITMREGMITGEVGGADATEEGLMTLMALSPDNTPDHQIAAGGTS